MIRPNYSLVNDVSGRAFGGPTNPYALFHRGVQTNSFLGAATVAGETELAGIPSGNTPPATWLPPLKAGGIASRREIQGTGAIVPFGLVEGRNLAATADGSGDLTGLGQLIVSLAAELAGSGDLTAEAEAFLQLAAELSGSGDLAGTIDALAAAIAALSGSGDLAAAVRATGTLEAALVVTGTGLTTANVGDAVWSYLIESGLSAAEAQRLLLAVAAGKTSGAGTSTMIFRDLGDTKDRVTGTLDGSGNRTAVTLDAE